MEKIAIITLFIAVWINILGGYDAIAKTMPKNSIAQSKDYKVVEQALSDTDIQFCALNVQGWTKLKQEKSTPEELDGIRKNIQQYLNLSDGDREDSNNYGNSIATRGKGKLTFHLNNSDEGTYLDIKLETANYQEGILYYQRINHLFNKYRSNDPVSFTLIGQTTEPLTEQAMQYLTEDILNQAEATLIEETHDDQLYTYSAYTDQIKNSIKVMDKKINLQIAYRQHEEEQTRVYISTPLIFCDY